MQGCREWGTEIPRNDAGLFCSGRVRCVFVSRSPQQWLFAPTIGLGRVLVAQGGDGTVERLASGELTELRLVVALRCGYSSALCFSWTAP